MQYRTENSFCVNEGSTSSPSCQAHAIQELATTEGARYLLGFSEFDDQGQLWDRKQMDAVIDKLLAETASKDLLITIFVHGWKHSAAPDDGNIETFRKFLAGLSENELHSSKTTGEPPRKVAGIYLSWRGGTVVVPGIENLTFWERKNTAQKLGRGGITEVLSRLEQLKRVKDIMSEENNSATRLVIVGHSFGGAIVHASLVQILEDRFVRTEGAEGTVTDAEGFGNLVVLINPAFEALQFATLSDMSVARTYFDTQLPIMAILTSEADYATRYAFPLGRNLSTLFERDRHIKRKNAQTGKNENIHEGEANVTAVGHFEPYRTHKLYPSAESPARTTSQLSSKESVCSALVAQREWKKDKPGSKIPIAGLTLERSDQSAGRNPYLVVRVDGSLITDHNDIDDGRIIEFLKELILVSTIRPGIGTNQLSRIFDCKM
jgi:hypothetical protein